MPTLLISCSRTTRPSFAVAFRFTPSKGAGNADVSMEPSVIVMVASGSMRLDCRANFHRERVDPGLDGCFGRNQIRENGQTCPTLDFQFPVEPGIQREIAR